MLNTDKVLIKSLGQLSDGQPWRIGLAHDRPHHLLIWVTRGQGRLLLDGTRRGMGPHNAIFVPAGRLFALELGRHCFGQTVAIPDSLPVRLPKMPRQLRVLEANAQNELTAHIEAGLREQVQERPLQQDTLEAYLALISVWLRRELLRDEHVPDRRNAGARLSQLFCEMVSRDFKSGLPMAAYAEALDVTPTHLARAVKAATGKTAATLLTERLHHAARSMLEETDHQMRDIARHLGFKSAAYFTRFVHQNTGLTPRQVRAASRIEKKVSVL